MVGHVVGPALRGRPLTAGAAVARPPQSERAVPAACWPPHPDQEAGLVERHVDAVDLAAAGRGLDEPEQHCRPHSADATVSAGLGLAAV